MIYREVLCSTLSILFSGLCGIVYFPCNTGHPLNMLNIVDIPSQALLYMISIYCIWCSD